MNGDYGYGWAGLGIGVVVFGIILYVGILALALWIGYLIMRTAVKNGILKADEERAARGMLPPPNGSSYGPPPQSPPGPPAPPQHPGTPPTTPCA